jgi:RNA polymerase sigma-70 factor (ECF subfamily)
MSRGLSDQTTDQELVTRIASGERDAFAMLFARRQGDVYRFALHMTASPSVAEDVTQEVFLAVMRDAARYDRNRAPVRVWLFGIARNHVRRRADQDRQMQPLDSIAKERDPPAGDVDLLGDLTRAERIATLREAVLRLPIAYREAIVLCDLQEMSYEDAATTLGCAIGTVRSRLHRGRALLAAKLTASDPLSAPGQVRVVHSRGPVKRCFV